MKKLIFVFSFLMVLGLVFMNCSKDKNDDNNDMGTNPNPTGIQITVGSGTTPQYSWTGGNVMSISVARQSDPTTVVWGAANPTSDGIASPVTHGTLPAGTVPTSVLPNPETTLTAGVAYRVSVARISGTATGYKDFTP